MNDTRRCPWTYWKHTDVPTTFVGPVSIESCDFSHENSPCCLDARGCQRWHKDGGFFVSQQEQWGRDRPPHWAPAGPRRDLAVSPALGHTLSPGSGTRPRCVALGTHALTTRLPGHREARQEVPGPALALGLPSSVGVFAQFPASASAVSRADAAPGGQCRLLSRPRSLCSRMVPDRLQRLLVKARTRVWPPRPGPRPCAAPASARPPALPLCACRFPAPRLVSSSRCPLPTDVAMSCLPPRPWGEPSLTSEATSDPAAPRGASAPALPFRPGQVCAASGQHGSARRPPSGSISADRRTQGGRRRGLAGGASAGWHGLLHQLLVHAQGSFERSFRRAGLPGVTRQEGLKARSPVSSTGGERARGRSRSAFPPCRGRALSLSQAHTGGSSVRCPDVPLPARRRPRLPPGDRRSQAWGPSVLQRCRRKPTVSWRMPVETAGT